jgi:hypothetical protein
MIGNFRQINQAVSQVAKFRKGSFTSYPEY